MDYSSIVMISRWQFALTAMYHFLFVPLTLGLSVLMALMETTYVITGKEVYRNMTKFWGKLFAINFAMGVATGITMEFQFGTNWAYYSHYVGDIFGLPLAVEGLMAFFLESTFIGIFFFGWDKVSKKKHLLATWMLALGTNLSGLWILIANAWMQNPIGSKFNPDTMRMEATSFYDMILNPVAQVKLAHTLSAGFVMGAAFVLGISSYYLLKGIHTDFAKRSASMAAVFGLLSITFSALVGDESGVQAYDHQPMKIAAVEANWRTDPDVIGTPLTLLAIPNQAKKTNLFAIEIPRGMSVMIARDLTTKLLSIEELVLKSEENIKEGLKYYQMLSDYQNGNISAEQKTDYKNQLSESYRYLGYAFLLKNLRQDIENATPQEIAIAAEATIPNVPLLFFSFRLMVGCGVVLILTFGLSFYYLNIRRNYGKKWLLFINLLAIPLPLLATQSGWIVAESGRQPWAIYEVLPTFLGVSSVSFGQVLTGLIGFIVLYSTLLVVDVYLMFKFARKGPDIA